MIKLQKYTVFLGLFLLLGIRAGAQEIELHTPLADTATLPFYEDRSSGSVSVPVSIQVTLSCPGETLKGSFVRLQHAVFPDTTYSAVTDSAGEVNFPSVYPGQYVISIDRFCYQPIQTAAVFNGPATLTHTMNRLKRPVWGLSVNVSSLLARWNPPPSAIFYWSPVVTNYEQFLTSRPIPAVHSNLLSLSYEITLVDFNWGVNLDVEISDGSGWQILKAYDASCGNIPWMLEHIDISAYAHADFQIRFNSYGQTSYVIEHWAVDNIRIIASAEVPSASVCISGYSPELNANPLPTVTDTLLYIPPDLVIFGQSNQLCVQAIYSNGTSSPACTTFNSAYLHPPLNFLGTSNSCVPFLTWIKPETSLGTTPAGILG